MILPIVFGVIGGAFVIVVGISGWFGRLLADRILTSHRARFDVELKNLQGQIDRTIIVHRAHFETEFAALRDIWTKVARLRAVFHQMEHPGPEPLVQAAARGAVNDATNELIRAIDQQSPFYSKGIYPDLDALRTLARQALADYTAEHAGTRVIERDYGEEVRVMAERISDKIRARIESLTVVA